MKNKRSKDIHLFKSRDKHVLVTVTIWPTLRALREANGMSARTKCYAYIQPWLYKDASGVSGEMHFAANHLNHEMTEHECTHLKRLIFDELELELHDADDEEICAELSGQLSAAVNEFVFAT